MRDLVTDPATHVPPDQVEDTLVSMPRSSAASVGLLFCQLVPFQRTTWGRCVPAGPKR